MILKRLNLKISIFITVYLAFLTLGSYSISVQTAPIIDKLSAWGGYIGGVSAVFAFCFAAFEYSRKLLSEGLDEREQLTLDAIPNLQRAWVELYLYSIEKSLGLRAYAKTHAPEYSIFNHHDDEWIKKHLDEYQRVLNQELETVKVKRDVFLEKHSKFLKLYNKLNYTSPYFSKSTSEEFEKYHKLACDTDCYIEDIQKDFMYKMNRHSAELNSSELFDMINELEGGNHYNSIFNFQYQDNVQCYIEEKNDQIFRSILNKLKPQ
ncbi:hypothetical protein [Pseudoalteromonas luteoviolacea]|uniref:hypothetical protein n=1 Tax=Pseudoalteromonas luteoviolacea TaxID=43657 RepID=UPI001B36FC37|nr:hypothetical protein [Pseudoalteromonas luteoviolacea]MBQ4836795.1 hypothetical protein [Pseudoalteromonas luteoviolacea]